MIIVAALLSGLLFGIGMIVSGMINPAKILNFLDVFGAWDPSLAFVLGGAIAVAMPGFYLIGRQLKPFFNDVFHLPTRTDVDLRLILGGTVFGTGWGLSGFCPGPALSGLPLLNTDTFMFVAALLVGMWMARLVMEKAS